jgi:uncharacterized membrane protein/uncharacterized membrane protein YbhN (UPF0104 family)
MRIKRFLRFFLGIPITILAFLFIAKIFIDNRVVIYKALTSLDPLLFLLGIFFFSLFFAVKSFVWIEILRKRGYTPPKRTTIFRYSLAEVKRYIPGSIFAFFGRMNAMADNVPQKETLKGIGIEAVLLALSAAVISLPALFYPLLKAQQVNVTVLMIASIAILLLIAITTFFYSRARKTILSYFDSFLLFLLAWFFYALGCFFTAISITWINPVNLLFILSFFVLSWLAGYLLFVTPMGLGIRELVITGSLSFFIPASIASVIAILTRLTMVIGELFYLFISYVFHKMKNNSKLLKINPYLAVVLFFAFLYFIFFASFTMQRHDAFLSGRFDLGNMSQTVWNTANGNFFMLTDPDGTQEISRLADHSDILLVLFAPLYLLWSDPKILLIMQSLSLAVGGIVVYLLAKLIIKNEKLSLVLSFSFLLNFWVHEQNIFDFHAVSIGTTLLLLTFYFLIRKKYFFFSLFLMLSVMTKENVLLVASIFGLYLLLKEKRRITGTLLTFIPAFAFFYLTSKAIPAARGGAHFALSYYSYIGDSTQDIVKNILFHPHIIFSHVFSFSTFSYLHQLLVPTGYLALLSPFYLIFALPELGIYLLSSNPNLRSFQYHYGAIIIPFVYVSTIYGIAFLLKKIRRKFIERTIFYYLLFVTGIVVYFYSPLPGMKNADNGPYITRNTSKVSDYLTLIPQSASVSASNNIGAHLSHRDKVYVVPNGINEADYIALYREKKSLVDLINTNTYNILIADEKNDFYLFVKKSFSNMGKKMSECKNCKP